jgi:hypothetical protein
MATADEIKIRIIAKDEASKVFRNTKGAADNLKSSLLGLKVGLAAATVAGGALLKSVIATGSQVQNLQVRMRFLTGSTEKGALAFKAMNRYASQVPFALEDIQSGVPSLLTVSKGTGELNNLLEITGDLAAASGLTFQETAMQIQRAYSGGIASAELFRERGISAMLGFEAGATYSAKKTKQVIEDAFRDGTTTVRGAAKSMADTFTGQVSMMQDAWFQLKMQLADTGLITEATKAIQELTETIKDPKFIEGAKTFSSALLDLFKFTVENWKILATVGGIWIGSQVGGIFGKKGTAIGGVVGGLATFLGLNEDIQKTLGLTSSEVEKSKIITIELQDAVDGANQKLKEQNIYLESIKQGMSDYSDTVKDVGTELTTAAQKGMRSFEDAMVDFVTGAKSAKDAFKDMARSIIADLIRIQIRQSIVNSLSGWLNGGTGTTGTTIQAASPRAFNTNEMIPLPSANGGGFTGYGSRSGGVDGKGGFPAILHPNETVLDHTQGQTGSQPIVQNIHVNTGVSQTVRAEIANLMPQIIRAAQSATADARMRGGAYSSAMGA